MVKCQNIAFEPQDNPIREPITKFGGQPVWLENAQWPLSQSTGEPMKFIGQIKLTEEMFPGREGKVAYLFMTDLDDYVDGTWEADGGENAIIVQPGGLPQVEVGPQETGPTIGRADNGAEGEPAEFLAHLTDSTDPDFVSEDDRFDSMSDEEQDQYQEAVSTNKLGGTPGFVQGDEYPDADPAAWNLLLQLDSGTVPFFVNFGDAGVGYAFINRDATVGKFLWQCS